MMLHLSDVHLLHHNKHYRWMDGCTLQDYLQDGYTNALGFPRPLPVLPVRSGYVYLQH